MKGYMKFITYEFECAECGTLQDVSEDNLRDAEMTLRHDHQWTAGEKYICPCCRNNR